MSPDADQDAVGVVTEFVHLLGSGEFDKCLAMIEADAVITEAPNLPFGGEWRGPQGFADMAKAVAKEYRLRLGEPVISAAGDRVLVRVSGTIAARASGREMPLDALDLYTVHGGRITGLDVYYKDAAAVTALREPAP